MRLSTAIFNGCDISKPCTGVLMKTTGETCALGAAGVGGKLWDGFQSFMADYDRNYSLHISFPVLSDVVMDPVEGMERTLEKIIIDLNDVYGWSRERIANWLRRKHKKGY